MTPLSGGGKKECAERKDGGVGWGGVGVRSIYSRRRRKRGGKEKNAKLKKVRERDSHRLLCVSQSSFVRRERREERKRASLSILVSFLFEVTLPPLLPPKPPQWVLMAAPLRGRGKGRERNLGARKISPFPVPPFLLRVKPLLLLPPPPPRPNDTFTTLTPKRRGGGGEAFFASVRS